MEADVNEIIKIYLGAGATGGYRPYGHDERMHAAFSNESESALRRIQKYLVAEPISPTPPADLAKGQKAFESELIQRFPELDTVAINALASAWSYSWR